MKPQTTNKSKEKGFKRIISRFWVWGIIALLFYVLFVLAPIKWDESGYGWNNYEGINLYKTIFAYFSAFAFLICIILLVIDVIKSIHKSKMGDYWKIAFTIIGIIGIIIFTIFYVKQYIPEKFNPDEYVKTTLQEDGYQVISNYYSELGNETWASVEMKSLGDRNKQVWNALTTFGVVYENATRYIITILTPENECSYWIDGNIYRAWTNYGKFDVWSYINSQIEKETERCS